MVKVSLGLVALSLGFLSSSLWGETFESLYSFPADGSNGAEPEATLTVGPDDSLYGTASLGGNNGAGTIFKVSLDGEVFIINDFETNTTGKKPYARLVNIGDGSLYGVTSENGNVTGDPAGTVFQLAPDGTLSVLAQLKLASGTFPRNPRSIVAAEQGALHVLGYEPGGLWRVPLNGGAATVTRNFSGTVAEGSFHEKMILGSDGFLYGGTYAGGVNSNGILFRVRPDGSGFTRLHNCESETGIRPIGAMVEGPDGNFYGTMSERGLNNGVIYRLTPTGDYTVLHFFKDLRYPEGDLMIASDGFIYGTAWDLGPGGNGSGGVFRIRPDGTEYKVVYGFDDQPTEPRYPNGRTPIGGLVQGADGHLYGTTKGGGQFDRGTVFRIKLDLPPPPVAVNDLAVTEGNPILIDVLANDFNPEEVVLTVSIKTAPSKGTATVQPGGSILYTPSAAYDGADEFQYKVTNGRGRSATALVQVTDIAPGALVQPGFYTGLLSLDPELDLQGDGPRAQFALVVQAPGSFTGAIYTQGKRVSLRGSFDSETGIATLPVTMPGMKKPDAVLFLGFRRGNPHTVVGALFTSKVWSAESEVWSGVAGPVQEDFAGKLSYTVLLSSDQSNPALPAGNGYGLMKILPRGLVAVIGKLGDGTRFSCGSALTALPGQEAAIPLYSEPLKSGVCAGVLTPPVRPAAAPVASANLDLSGQLSWVRPGVTKPTRKPKPYAEGFFGSVQMYASNFVPPSSSSAVLDLEAGVVIVGNGPLEETAVGKFTLNGKKVRTSAPLRSLSFNRKTGLFSGKIQAEGKTIKFQGVVAQTIGVGAGQFNIKGETGAVLLQADVN